MSLSKQDAAQLMGMRESEVVSVKAAPGGHIVTTHDGFQTLLTDDGGFVFGADAITDHYAPQEEAADVEAESAAPSAPAKKAAPKKATG